MKTIRAVRLFYLVYTFYTIFIVAISNYRYIYAICGLALMWLSYYAFKIGYLTSKSYISEKAIEDKRGEPDSKLSIYQWSSSYYFTTSITSWLCALLAAKYYTGRSFTTVISGFFGGNDAYYSYQRYFQANHLNVFSLSKIPYILMLVYLTTIMLWSIISLVSESRTLGYKRIIYLLSVTLAYAYFGAARGTNFETYILFVVFTYSLLIKNNKDYSKRLLYISLIIIVGICLVQIYRLRILDRGISFDNGICEEITVRESSAFIRSFPALSNILISVFSYLGYGIYCIGVAIWDIYTGSTTGILALFVPLGNDLILNSDIRELLLQNVVLGARWIPDLLLIVNKIGLVLYFVLLFCIGRFLQVLDNYCGPKDIRNAISALIFIELLSIPVGNFLLASTSNEITVLLFLIAYIKNSGVKIKIKL